MRNIFDQYSQPENRLTHALASCLHEDRALLSKFVKWVTGESAPKKLFILEQQLPDEEEIPEFELDRRGLPDAWIHDGWDWCILIESKVSSTLSVDQLQRHYNTAKKRGFSKIQVIALDTSPLTVILPEYAQLLNWRQVYSWMTEQNTVSDWSRRYTRYMEIAESKLVNDGYLREGTLTEFNGIHIDEDNPYTYPEGKRLIKLLMEELRQHPSLLSGIPIDPAAPGRGAITGSRGTVVWDFLWIQGLYDGGKHTSAPHLTYYMNQDSLNAALMLPNSLKGSYRRKIIELEEEGFLDIVNAVYKALKPILKVAPTATPYFSGTQRWFATQRSKPVINANMKFDLRTAVQDSQSTVKYQPQWLGAGYELLCNKKSNLEFSVGMTFPYQSTKKIKTKEVLDVIAESWLATTPLIDVMLDR